PEPDVLANGRTGTAARAHAHLAPLGVAQRVTMPRDAPAGHLEAHDLAGQRLGLHLLDGRAPDEVALPHLHRPRKAGLDGVRGLVDLVAVEREARLQPQRVARAEPGRLEAERAPDLHELPEEAGRVVPGAEHLDAVLARVPGAGGGHAHVADHGVSEG